VRKLVALAAVCGTALVVAVSPASTAKIDNINGGPVCADILNDSGITDYSAGIVTFALRTAAPSCRGVLYTVNVYDDTAAHNFLGSGSSYGTKAAAADDPTTGIVFVTVPLSSSADPNAQSFCIVATSSDDRVFDRAPDGPTPFCISFNTPQSGSSGGQTGFN
jgi:hypothetical protein